MQNTKNKIYLTFSIVVVIIFFIVASATYLGNKSKQTESAEEPVTQVQPSSNIDSEGEKIEEPIIVEREKSATPAPKKEISIEEYVSYLEQIFNKKWKSICEKQGDKLVAEYALIINKDGTLLSYHVAEEGENFGKYKNVIARVIKNLSPYKPLPAGFSNNDSVLMISFNNNGQVNVKVTEKPVQTEGVWNKSAYASYLTDLLSPKWQDVYLSEEDEMKLVEKFLLALKPDGTIFYIDSLREGEYVGQYTGVIEKIIKDSAPYKQIPADFSDNEAIMQLSFYSNGQVLIDIFKRAKAGVEQIEHQERVNEWRVKHGYLPFKVRDYYYVKDTD